MGAATGVGYAYKKGYFSKSDSDASRSVPGTGKAQNGGAPRTGSDIQEAVNAIDQEEATQRQFKFKIFLCVLFAVIAYLLWKEMSREESEDEVEDDLSEWDAKMPRWSEGSDGSDDSNELMPVDPLGRRIRRKEAKQGRHWPWWDRMKNHFEL